MIKQVALGIGFLVVGWSTPVMFKELFGIDIPLWVAIIMTLIGVGMISWGLLPRKVKDWSQEKVTLLWPEGYFDKKKKKSKTRENNAKT